jgi:hypothetical protein
LLDRAAYDISATVGGLFHQPPTKQIIATRVPDLGWSPEAKQTIASWVEQLGWTCHSVEPASEFMRSFPQYRRLIPMVA